ncbi:MAG: hypothetical protein HC903_20220 [Methylacidiphilales bacterium]|nr:hypothetical protein [Candidatus Methylacidiphilales bacterium]
MKRTILAFSLVASQIVFMPLAFAFPPSGTYTRSCNNIRRDGGDLIASCKNKNDKRVQTRLRNYASCRPGTIFNRNGNLLCDRK